MKTYNFIKHLSILGIFIFLAIIVSPVIAGKTNPNAIIGGTLACDAYYKVDYTPTNTAAWKFSNFNDSSIYVDRIRTYDSKGVLFRDYQWNEDEFTEASGTGLLLPQDNLETINAGDNGISGRQQVFYHSQTLLGTSFLPAPGHVILMLDWSANTPVYPLVGKVIRHHLGSTGILARDGFACKMIHTEYGK